MAYIEIIEKRDRVNYIMGRIRVNIRFLYELFIIDGFGSFDGTYESLDKNVFNLKQFIEAVLEANKPSMKDEMQKYARNVLDKLNKWDDNSLINTKNKKQ